MREGREPSRNVENKTSGEVKWLTEKGNLWTLKLWVKKFFEAGFLHGRRGRGRPDGDHHPLAEFGPERPEALLKQCEEKEEDRGDMGKQEMRQKERNWEKQEKEEFHEAWVRRWLRREKRLWKREGRLLDYRDLRG